MSSILKALQRLERDRAGSREHEPALSGELSEELTTPTPAPRRVQPAVWLGIGLALVVTAAGAWLGAPWLATQVGDTPAVVASVRHADPAPTTRSAPRAETAPAPAEESPFGERPAREAPPRNVAPAPAPTREVAAAPSVQEAPRSAPVATAPATSPPAERTEMPAREPKAEPAALVESRPSQVAAAPRSEPAAPPVKSRPPEEPAASSPTKTTPRPKSEARPPPSAAPKPKPAPPARVKPAAPPPATVASAGLAPELAVLRTSWHPTPSRRAARVKIAGSDAVLEMREGDTTGALRVMKIEPSAVVFTFQGKEVRRAVGK